MRDSKSVVAASKEYPKVVTGYYAQAFKKTKQEQDLLKEAKHRNKAAVAKDFPNQTPEQRKRILNPKNQIWGD